MTEFATQAAQNQLDVLEVTEDVPDTIRPLGSFEHLFWLIDQRGPIHFAVTAQVSGRTSPRDWRQALDIVQERHPLLSVRVERSPGSIPQFRQVDAVPIPLRIVEDDPTTRWEAEVGEELATPLDPNGAPLIRAVLVRAFTTLPSCWSRITPSPTASHSPTSSATRFMRSPAASSHRSPYCPRRRTCSVSIICRPNERVPASRTAMRLP